ncbi:glycosyltransferase family 2 protein [Aulographum hederae CBS 113979]|uniref:Glycosyltransferase family 2 protein n=1 Tax=Aulographum hederae CBS 113979 TaxID=1176131 RepID=A0A6G1GNF5_9PEZI|nr:glycosyltransferase family 2 protein [Aulographum hederae CBS 113979]
MPLSLLNAIMGISRNLGCAQRKPAACFVQLPLWLWPLWLFCLGASSLYPASRSQRSFPHLTVFPVHLRSSSTSCSTRTPRSSFWWRFATLGSSFTCSRPNVLYRISPILPNPTYSAEDVTVILPTIDPTNKYFAETLRLILAASTQEVFVVAGGTKKLEQATQICAGFSSERIQVLATNFASKRQQLALAIPLVRTPITVFVDDHVFWPSPKFLSTILAAFEDPAVGIVGMSKRVVRYPGLGVSCKDFWKFIGCLCLERRNFDARGTNAIDGGVSTVSGRCVGLRTKIIQDAKFLTQYLNEYFFFGSLAPCTSMTTSSPLGIWSRMAGASRPKIPRTLGWKLRWVLRGRLGSGITNSSAGACDGSYFNFALIIDPALFVLLSKTDFADGNPAAFAWLGLWMFLSKMLYAMVTFWKTTWGGRDLEEVNIEAAKAKSAPVMGTLAHKDKSNGHAQTPQQRRANEKFARSEAAKRGKPEAAVKKSEPGKSTISKGWLILLVFVVCGSLIFEVMRLLFFKN